MAHSLWAMATGRPGLAPAFVADSTHDGRTVFRYAMADGGPGALIGRHGFLSVAHCMASSVQETCIVEGTAKRHATAVLASICGAARGCVRSGVPVGQGCR